MCETDTQEAVETPSCPAKRVSLAKSVREAAKAQGLNVTVEKLTRGFVITVCDADGKRTDRIKLRALSRKKSTFRLGVASRLRYDERLKPLIKPLLGESPAKGGLRIKWSTEPVRLTGDDVVELIAAVAADRLALQEAVNAFLTEQLEAAGLTLDAGMKRKDVKEKIKALDVEAMVTAFTESAVFEVIDTGAVGTLIDRLTHPEGEVVEDEAPACEAEPAPAVEGEPVVEVAPCCCGCDAK